MELAWYVVILGVLTRDDGDIHLHSSKDAVHGVVIWHLRCIVVVIDQLDQNKRRCEADTGLLPLASVTYQKEC